MTYHYWDSCVILGWLKGEPDKEKECRAAIRAAERGEVKVITSSLTLAEVLRLKGEQPIPKEDREKVRQFFENDYLALYDVDRTIAERAQDVVWDHGIAPKDAIHIATALSLSSRIALEQFDTFDKELIEHSGKLGDSPKLKIGRPNFPGQLF